jgi:hypothetical protein
MGRYEIKQRDRSPRSWYIWDNVKGGPVCDVFGNTCYFQRLREAEEIAKYK